MVSTTTTRQAGDRDRNKDSVAIPAHIRQIFGNSPLGFNAGDANLYRYVGNDATNNTDPSGLQDWPSGTKPPPRDLYDPDDNVRRYYPPQSRNARGLKVAIITDDTCDDDYFSWVSQGNTHNGGTMTEPGAGRKVGGYEDLRKALRRYRDGSISVLVISGNIGGTCSARTKSREDIGGPDMPADIYELIRQKLVKDKNGHVTGSVVITSCHAGGSARNVKRTVYKLGVDLTVSVGWCRGNRKGFEGGGSSSEPWYTVGPTSSQLDIEDQMERHTASPDHPLYPRK